MKLSGNTIFLTGGSSGIGKSMAKKLLELGNEVIICSRNQDQLKKVAEENPGLHYIRCDINSDADRRGALAHIQKEFPQTNVLINNAAIQSNYDLKTGEDGLKAMDEEISIVLNAPIHLTGLFLPQLLQAADPVIVNVTSMLGLTPLPRIPIYCAAKAGFHVYTLLLRDHLKDTPISVYEVPPPKVETNLNLAGKSGVKPGTEAAVGLDPDEYAAFVIEKLGEGMKEILYPPFDKVMHEMTRAESEIMRIQ